MNSVLGLYLSPREGGNSDLMLDEFLRGCKEMGADVQSVIARKLKIQPCIECGACDETGECVLKDDMDEIYPLLIGTKRLVVASPVFFYGLPGHGKALVDRSQALWNRVRLNPELRRNDGKGFFIGVGATKGRNLFDGTTLTVKYFLDALGMPLEMESLTFRQVEHKGAIKEHPSALREAYEAGQTFVS